MPIDALVENEWRRYDDATFELGVAIAYKRVGKEHSPVDVHSLRRIFINNKGVEPREYPSLINKFIAQQRAIINRKQTEKNPGIAKLLVERFQRTTHSFVAYGDLCLFASAYHGGIGDAPLEEMARLGYERAASFHNSGRNIPDLVAILKEYGIDYERENRYYKTLAMRTPVYHRVIGQLKEILPSMESIDEAIPFEIFLEPEVELSPREQRLVEAAEEESTRFLSMMERRILLSRLDFETLGRRLRANVLGQDQAVDDLLRFILHYRTGLAEKKGLLSFFAAGPTGVGKNHLIEMLQQELEDMTGRKTLLEKIECVNYQNDASLNTILGSWPGYINSNMKGKLTRFAEEAAWYPFSFLILDEFEKAHKRLEVALLPILDKGFTADHLGRRVDLRGSLLYFTSNIGHELWRRRGVGFKNSSRDEIQREAVLQAARQAFNPEFINRLHIVTFNHLEPATVERIVERELGLLGSELKEEFGIDFSWDPEVTSHLLEVGYSETYGARPIRRAINELVIAPLDQTIHLYGRNAATEQAVERVLDTIDQLRQEEKELSAQEAAKLLAHIRRHALPHVGIKRIEVHKERDGLVFEVR